MQLLENSIATGAGLIALIVAFMSVSGAHFNPVVTLASRVAGHLDNRETGVYVIAQIAGGCAGAVVANLMFDLPAVTLSTHDRSSAGVLLGEVVATFGLLLVILGVVRSGRSSFVAFAVGGYIAAAYWFTSSTSFANPAVTIARTLTNTFAGISPSSVPAFIGAQVLAAIAAIVFCGYLWSERVRGAMTTPHVLFLCVHNAGRSQMALGWFEALAGGRAVAASGGSEPAAGVNPVAVEAMAEVGIDVGRTPPRRWTDLDLRRGRRRDHDGLWRRMSVRPREALRRLAGRGSRRSAARASAHDP